MDEDKPLHMNEGGVIQAEVQAGPTISCIICAYNEGRRIRSVLDAVAGYPGFSEVIVVDDGSVDGTAAAVRAYPNVNLISYGENRGKTYAMAQGIAAATGDYLMFLDADLINLKAADIHALQAPVLAGQADTSISLRGNSLQIYRRIGLDFISGERLIPRSLVADQVAVMEELPRWGGEAFINERLIDSRLSIIVVDWPNVVNCRKQEKVGAVQGMMEDLRMIGDACKVLSPLGFARQTFGMLKLVVS